MTEPKNTDSGTDPAAESGLSEAQSQEPQTPQAESKPPVERGGPKGLEPTRYGDWERKGRCIDF